MGSCFGKLTYKKETELPEVPAGYGKKQTILAHQQKQWAVTGVVSLRDSKLKELPPGLENLVDVVKVIDVSSNLLESLPPMLSSMHKLERMIAAGNRISQIRCQMTDWKKLKVLDLSQNALSIFPDEVSCCVSLETLKLSGNLLTDMPATIQQCTKLKELHLARNSLQSLPESMGYCAGLEVIDCSANRLRELPVALGSLKKLRRLILNDNSQLRSIPGAVLQDCIMLHTLELHSTLVSREVLNKTEGYAAFEQRRQKKFSKAIDGNAMVNQGGVDEGVDVHLK